MNVHQQPSAFVAPAAHPAIVELGGRRQWVAWRWKKMEDGRLTKPPVSPRTGHGASHSRPEHWSSFSEAVAFAASRNLPGVGFVMTDDDGLTGVDLDKCRNPESGEIEPWAREILDLAETYAEVSPSGRGIRMFWRGKIESTVKCDLAHVELYVSHRYLTITGRHVEGTPLEIRDAPETHRRLIERVEAFTRPAGATEGRRLRENEDGTAFDLETGEVFDTIAEAEGAHAETLAGETTSSTSLPARPDRGGGDFFRAVNEAALSHLSAWVPALFGSVAKPQAGTGAYRISSTALGRDLEEDLSIAPGGIVDFGVHDMGDARAGKRTAIDLVIEYGSAPDAAIWLCNMMNADPADLGWRGNGLGSAEHGAEVAARLLAPVLDEASLKALRKRLTPQRRGELAITTFDGGRTAEGHVETLTMLLKLDGFSQAEACALLADCPAGKTVGAQGRDVGLLVWRKWMLLATPTSGKASAVGTGLDLVPASSFAGKERPQREFLDSAGLIPCRNVTLLFGDGGTGKSLLALQLSCGAAITGSWLGLNVRRGGVLYFSAEDDETETHIRLAEIAEAEGFDLADADGLHIAFMAGMDAVLASENARSALVEWTALFDRLRHSLDKVRPKLLVLDNLADIFAGNENARSPARQFIGRLRGLAIEFDCSIIVLAHPSISGMASGSGTSGNLAWGNSARSRLYFHREIGDDGTEANPNRRSLDVKKLNYGPTGRSIPLEWQSGRFIALDQPSGATGTFDAAAKIMRAERVFLEMVRRFNREGRNISPSRSPTFAPVVFARHPMSEGVRPREFETAMDVLLDRGEIEVVQVGPPSKRRHNLVVREASE